MSIFEEVLSDVLIAQCQCCRRVVGAVPKHLSHTPQTCDRVAVWPRGARASQGAAPSLCRAQSSATGRACEASVNREVSPYPRSDASSLRQPQRSVNPRPQPLVRCGALVHGSPSSLPHEERHARPRYGTSIHRFAELVSGYRRVVGEKTEAEELINLVSESIEASVVRHRPVCGCRSRRRS